MSTIDSSTSSSILIRMHDPEKEVVSMSEEAIHTPLSTAMIGGAIAGTAEHLVMFPVDTVKTRLQVIGQPGMPLYRNVFHAFKSIHQQEGLLRLYRGLPAIFLTAGPSHAAYFSVLESLRYSLSSHSRTKQNEPLVNAMAGVGATVAHDLIVTPLDVVKQRLQVAGSTYRGVSHGLYSILKNEGIRALFASYPVTLAMNVPFMAVFVSSYETLKLRLENSNAIHGTPQHLISAAVAGVVAGFLTTPLDVIKTRIQVTGVKESITKSLFFSTRDVYMKRGFSGYFQGAGARALYFAPSAAICWSTYEIAKEVFGVDLGDMDDIAHV